MYRPWRSRKFNGAYFWARRHSAPLSSINHGNAGAPIFCAGLSDNFLRREPVELAVVESQERAQHFTRMLAEERRGARRFTGGFAKTPPGGARGGRAAGTSGDAPLLVSVEVARPCHEPT